jgi:regulator of protease activity HflC (stomatin/prohibitin superfamily)
MMKLLKLLTGLLYVVIPIFGWAALYFSIKRVKPGDISVVKTWDKATILTPGLYFYPFPWESFGESFSNALNYIDFGALIRIRVLPGQVGVKMTTKNTYQELAAGEHIIDISAGELFDKATGFQNPSAASYTIGTKKTITLTENQVAIIDTPTGIEVIDKAEKHTFDQSEKKSLREIINTGSQVLPLPALTVQCTDRINMKAEAMLTYKIKHPLKTISLGMNTILTNLQKLGDASLRTILSQHSSADIAPSPHKTEDNDGSKRIAVLKEIHDQFLQELATKATEWGVEISDLVITEILPSDRNYQDTIQQLGVKQATAEAELTLAQTSSNIAAINAKAEQSRIIAAEKEQQEAFIRMKTQTDNLRALATAERDAEVLKAEGEAKAIEIRAVAKAKELELLNTATLNATELTKELSTLRAKGDILGSIKSPVYVPQPDMGTLRIYTEKNGLRQSIFNSGAAGNGTDSQSAIGDLVTLNTMAAMQQSNA